MIGTIDITVNAAHPNLALDQVCGFVGSPSSFRISNVPNKIGVWRITDVRVVVTSPDNLVHTANCIHTNDVWVGTVEGSQRTGKTIGGVQIVADGTDENGNTVTGYILGVGDYLVLNCDNTEGETKYALHLHDEMPMHPTKADVVRISADWKMYDGTSWIPFGGDNDYDKLHNKPSINGVMLSGNMTDTALSLANKSELPTKTSQLSNDSGFLSAHQDISGKRDRTDNLCHKSSYSEWVASSVPSRFEPIDQPWFSNDGPCWWWKCRDTQYGSATCLFHADWQPETATSLRFEYASSGFDAKRKLVAAEQKVFSTYDYVDAVVSGYTSLELFNQTVGNLESIISGI